MDTKIIFLAVTASILNACGAWHYYGHDYDETPLGDAIDKASMKILKEGFEEAPDKNVIASPLGVLLLLSLYSSGAGRSTQDEIYRILGDSDSKKVLDSYSGLTARFSAMDSNFLTLANKIYVAKQYQLDNSFTQVARSYRSEVENIDFGQPADAAATINKWADEKTKGHIKNPVSADAITPDVAVALFNVIFFQGHWHVPFNASETKDKDFHVDKSTTVQKPTMHLYQSLFYHESKDLGAQLIELPYKEAGFRMVVVLPNEIDGLPSVLEKVAQKGVLADVFKLSPSGRDIDLNIPKFEIKSNWDLNSILNKVGVSSLFSEAATGIVKNGSVVVSKAFQEAFVKVDEEGATAGAFTGLIAVTLSYPPEIPPALQIKVDHPFLFLILFEDKIVFAGTYAH